MGFPYSLGMEEMALYILDNFEWHHREVVFPTGPLPYDYGELRPDLSLNVAKVYTQIYKLPEFP